MAAEMKHEYVVVGGGIAGVSCSEHVKADIWNKFSSSCII